MYISPFLIKGSSTCLSNVLLVSQTCTTHYITTRTKGLWSIPAIDSITPGPRATLRITPFQLVSFNQLKMSICIIYSVIIDTYNIPTVVQYFFHELFSNNDHPYRYLILGGGGGGRQMP